MAKTNVRIDPMKEYCPWCWNIRGTGHIDCTRPKHVWWKDNDIGMIKMRWYWFLALVVFLSLAVSGAVLYGIFWFTNNIGG